MNAWKPLIMALGLLAALPLTSEGAAPKASRPATASECVAPSGGTWTFGRAPVGCDPKSEASTLQTRYPELVYDERNGGEQPRYSSSLYAFLRESADYYLAERRRNPTESEKQAWRRAVMTMAHQESFWSHYRVAKKDNRFKIMRGDRNFAHGLLQIDERWHPKLTMNERGEDLTTHLMYGLDMYFQGWERAASAPCVRKGNGEDRARAAYAAYNGGPKQLCRWANAKSRWAQNDKGFLDKWKSQSWVAIVGKAAPRSPVDLGCLLEGKGGCISVLEPKLTIYRYQAKTNPPRIEDSLAAAAILSRAGRSNKQKLFS